MLAPTGAPLFFLYSLAENLGKSFDEIRQFSDAEIEGWRAYYAAKLEYKKR